MDGVLAYICMFGGNFAPNGWGLCQGQIIAVSTNTALFSLLGTTYGGNGQTTFALPDLRGRIVVGQGQGAGLSSKDLGESAGTETATLSATTMPAHTHSVAMAITVGAAVNANTSSPVNAVYANADELLYNGSQDTSMKSYTGTINTGDTGSASPTPFSIINPVLGLNYVICMQGVFPSRN